MSAATAAATAALKTFFTTDVVCRETAIVQTVEFVVGELLKAKQLGCLTVREIHLIFKFFNLLFKHSHRAFVLTVLTAEILIVPRLVAVMFVALFEPENDDSKDNHHTKNPSNVF